MATFSPNLNNQQGSTGGSQKKSDYTPFIPDGDPKAVVGATSAAKASLAKSSAPSLAQRALGKQAGTQQSSTQPAAQIPSQASNPAAQPPIQPIPVGIAATAQPQVPFHQAPYQHLYGANHQMHQQQQPTSKKLFRQNHAGMSREQFRNFIIGLFAVSMVIFLILVLSLGSKKSYSHQQQIKRVQGVNLVYPNYDGLVSPPFIVSGEAERFWFDDDGSFPVSIFDKNGNLVSLAYAHAQSDWRDDGFIPFISVVERYDLNPTHKLGRVELQQPDVEVTEFTTMTIPIEFIDCGKRANKKGVCLTGTAYEFFRIGQRDRRIIVGRDLEGNDVYATINADGSLITEASTDGSGGDDGSDGGGGIDGGGDTTFSLRSMTLYAPNVNNNPFNPSCAALTAVTRPFEGDASTGSMREVLDALLSGPNQTEASRGYYHMFSNGLAINDLSLSNNTLSITLSSDNLVRDTTFCNLINAKQAIERTMLQFSNVNDVRIFAEGRAL